MPLRYPLSSLSLKAAVKTWRSQERSSMEFSSWEDIFLKAPTGMRVRTCLMRPLERHLMRPSEQHLMRPSNHHHHYQPAASRTRNSETSRPTATDRKLEPQTEDTQNHLHHLNHRPPVLLDQPPQYNAQFSDPMGERDHHNHHHQQLHQQ
ncbi:hypothetical protein QJS04_geneDACA000288 [Acorus gramineus]|uniref:Uncharacterized protein n=1 Tax=Acorus gramineus TaxID=55184 RepID=A0AAV9AQ61_ACOGR|nr:hypothetical protein QJS04_geneDACA000288 [Acorus gramineus]